MSLRADPVVASVDGAPPLARLRLVRFAHAGEPRLGAALEDGAVVDLNHAYTELLLRRGHPRARETAAYLVPPVLREFLGSGADGLAAAREAVAAAQAAGGPAAAVRRDVTRLPVADDRAQIICAGRNYREHVREAGAEEPDLPVLFLRLHASLVAHGDPIVRPRVSTQLDYEGELAVVIGRRCRYVAEADAFDVIAGFTIFNDVTVRDYQRRTPQWTAGKNFASTGPLGPYVIPRADLADPQNLTITVMLNGEVVQQASTAQMIFPIGTLIAHASEFTQLEPGDIIATGTPSGVGFARNPPRFLQPGDRIAVELEGIGVLENTVVDEDLGGRP